MYQIYTLSDPRTMAVRYLGISRNALKRLATHIQGIEVGNTEKTRWLQELIDINMLPIVNVIEEVETLEQAKEREKYLIRQYLSTGIPLTNTTYKQRKQPPIIRQSRPIATVAKVAKTKDPWLSVREISQTLRVPETSVRDWIRTERLIAYKLGKRFKIKESDLEMFIESSKQ